MSRSAVLTQNPHAFFSHSYARGYAHHLLKWVQRKVRATSERKVQDEEPRSGQNAHLQISMAEVGILSGSGLAIWSKILPELLKEWVDASGSFSGGGSRTAVGGQHEKTTSFRMFGYDLDPTVYERNARNLVENRNAFGPGGHKKPFVFKLVQGLSVWLNRERVRRSLKFAAEFSDAEVSEVEVGHRVQEVVYNRDPLNLDLRLPEREVRLRTSSSARTPSSNATFSLLIDDAYHSDESILDTWDIFHPFLQKPWTFFVEDNCGVVYKLREKISFDVAEIYLHKGPKPNDCLIVAESRDSRS
eukprot:g14151.t1